MMAEALLHCVRLRTAHFRGGHVVDGEGGVSSVREGGGEDDWVTLSDERLPPLCTRTYCSPTTLVYKRGGLYIAAASRITLSTAPAANDRPTSSHQPFRGTRSVARRYARTHTPTRPL